MARKVTVKRLMREYLETNAAQRLEQAGAAWTSQTMGFYFPGNEDTVDLCALTVLREALSLDGTTVSDSVRRGVRDLVNTGTTVDNAITTIWLATFQPA